MDTRFVSCWEPAVCLMAIPDEKLETQRQTAICNFSVTKLYVVESLLHKSYAIVFYQNGSVRFYTVKIYINTCVSQTNMGFFEAHVAKF